MDKGQSKRKSADEESIERSSTSSSISPEAISVGSGQYDVFLSFRGPDTRNAFTDCLYHSLVEAGTVPIQVFRDDNNIPIGEEFGSEIFDAIAQSKISIPIISENYASSKWCIRELIHIMNRKKSTSHIVLPIFYKVSATDVRHLTGKFGDAFRRRLKRFDEKDIQQGQQALNEVSHLNGWESEKIANGREGKLIELVVKTVLSKLQKDFQLVVPGQLVGLDGQLKKIMDWIHSPSVNARMIGIYGMGGIGKTTLAKCVHNKVLDKFVEASFLPDIREKATQHHGIENLQRQLIFDILHRKIDVLRIDDGINIIKFGFRGKKVLILLDDIDNKKQLDALAGKHNWFMAGSMIIVTTRNQTILDQCGFEVVYKYEMKEINEVRSLLLFNRHAFHMDRSPRDFEGISRDITSTMGGLPLALEVVGSYLYSYKNKKVWEDVRKQLKDISHLKDQPYGDVLKILQISYDALDDGLKQIFLDIACFLIDKSSHHAIYMWEDCGLYPNRGIEELKLRCLIKIDYAGFFKMHDQLRDLGRSIFCQRLEKSSIPRDYGYDGFPRALINPKGHPWFSDCLEAASSGDSKFYEVRWFEWALLGNDASFSTINLHLPKLSVLDLWQGESWVGITENWEGWNSFKASKQLKVLKVGLCPNLRCTPELSAFTQLKILQLRNCDGLEHLHPSIGELTSLVILDLCACVRLNELPEEVGGLKDLEELLLDESSIAEIPLSIGFLRKLKTLSAGLCELLREIPSSIGDLQNLHHLNLEGTAIEKLPSAIGGLKNLQILNLTWCSSLKGAIPSEIGDLPSLETIGLHCTLISDLPESIRNLSSLQSLNLRDCKELRSLPALPSSLQSLDLRGCKEFRSLPELPSSLQSLELSGCYKLRSLPELPSSLRSLELRGCYKLQSLPELPSRLTCLLVTCQSLGVSQLLRLIHLEKLDLEVRHLPEDIRELSSIALKLCFEEWDKLTSLSLSGFTHLEELSIKKCSSIKTLSLSGFIHLKRLCIEHCESLVEIKCCDNLESLEVIFLYFCKCLKKFKAFRCGNLIEIQGLDCANSLEELDFTGCKSMENLPDLTGCEKLRSLRVQDCKKLAHLRGLEMLNLTYLDISGCDSLEAIPNLFLYECKHLKEFKASRCGNLIEIQGLDGVNSLEELDFTGCKSMETLPDLTGCKRLRFLIVRDCKKLAHLRELEMLNLTYLDISGCDSLGAMLNLVLYDCKHLKKFKASGCGNLVKIQGLDGAKFLEELDFTGCKSMETLPDLTGCKRLQSLIVRDCKKLAQLRGLEMLRLIYLDISGCDSLEAIPNIFALRVNRNYDLRPLFTF